MLCLVKSYEVDGRDVQLGMDQRRAPIYDALHSYMQQRPNSYHIPGHKGKIAHLLLSDWAAADLTEITGMDDLHAPTGIIKEAEELTAACFGADRSFLLVGGSTVGNMAALLALCEPGDVVLVDRHAHKSVLHGLMLCRAQAVFLPVQIDPLSGLPLGIDEQILAEAIAEYPKCKAVVVTCPNYYGCGPNMNGIADLVHGLDIPLIVDEAHGVHFGFHPELPSSALQEGADAVIQSAHKMGGSLTMGAYLHLRGERLSGEKIRQCLSMVQTSSPSYPLLASLDVFRREWALRGEQLIAKGLRAAKALRSSVLKQGRFEVNEASLYASPDAGKTDPFKLYVQDRTGRLDGYALQAELEKRSCMVEMADPRGVLLVFTYNSTMDDYRCLYQAFLDIGKASISVGDGRAGSSRPSYRRESPCLYTSREWNSPVDFSSWQQLKDTENVPLADAAGRVSAEMIVPYPPGIPVICKGERISSDVLEQLHALRHKGARFQGVSDQALNTVKVETE